MQTDYTEQDSERARRIEGSSAGMDTQQLSPAHSPVPVTASAQSGPRDFSRGSNLAALLLLGGGVLLLLGRFMPNSEEMTGGMVLLTIASCFLFFAFWKRLYGLMIPGAILGGLSLGVTFAGVTDGVSVLWGLALGFLSILLLGKALFGVQSNWAIFPAIPLFAVGIIVAVANMPGLFAGGLVWLPLLLIGAGLFLGWGRGRRA